MKIRKNRLKKLNPLKSSFEKLYRTYSFEYLTTDPLWFVHQYKKVCDQEIVAFIASAVAYGNVKQIFKTLHLLFKELGSSPAEFIQNYSPEKQPNLFEGIYHRFHAPEDFRILIFLLSRIYQKENSLKISFQKHFQPENENIAVSLSKWISEILSEKPVPFYPDGTLPSHAPVRFFFSSPENGSSCKRMNLFLRWMVRKDKIDLGLWDFIKPSKLMIPLDTHIFKISRLLGLTARNSANWKTVEEITNQLKILDPFDPIKYDFALTRLGILKIPFPKNKISASHLLAEIADSAGVTQW